MSNTFLHSKITTEPYCISKFEFAHLGKKSKVKYIRRGYHSRRHDGGN